MTPVRIIETKNETFVDDEMAENDKVAALDTTVGPFKAMASEIFGVKHVIAIFPEGVEEKKIGLNGASVHREYQKDGNTIGLTAEWQPESALEHHRTNHRHHNS